jgi:hypothetical protein
MDVDIPSFEPTLKYTPQFDLFPFFESVNDGYMNYFDSKALLGRDKVIQEINDIIGRRELDKYQPIIISTSRGMGKTFLMKCVGTQKVKEQLKCGLIVDALKFGRIISFDFAAAAQFAIPTEKDIPTFFTRLLIYYLCRLFNGTMVDGIEFELISQFGEIVGFQGKQVAFRTWLLNSNRLNAEDMMTEYIRLTNIAFKTQSDSPPVFLLDEIQGLCKTTKVQSTFNANNVIVCHSFLSLLLTQLAGKHKPVCICTGTNNGSIISITEKSKIIPKIISLTTFSEEREYTLFWAQMTEYLNSKNSNAKIFENNSIFTSLVYASYQIPRLLLLAHSVWYESNFNDQFLVQKYEESATIYYGEMASLLTSKDFSVNDICHILLSCGVHWRVGNLDDTVPGTEIKWNLLIQLSLVFPHLDGCYVFPFHLMWRAKTPTMTEIETYHKIRSDIEDRCSCVIEGLNIEDLFHSYDKLCSANLYNIGIYYETLFASSLAVKYYLKSITLNQKAINLLEIINLNTKHSAYKILKNYQVDFSGGIFLPDEKEALSSFNNLPKAVIHNKKKHNAHHDIILPAISNGTRLNIAVQCKASFDLSQKKTIESQLFVSKEQEAQSVQQLIWLYLGEETREKGYPKVAFLNGSRCCNGLSLSLFELLKKLKLKVSS